MADIGLNFLKYLKGKSDFKRLAAMLKQTVQKTVSTSALKKNSVCNVVKLFKRKFLLNQAEKSLRKMKESK